MNSESANPRAKLRLIDPTPSLAEPTGPVRGDREREQQRRAWSYVDEVNDLILENDGQGVGAVIALDAEATRAALAREEADLADSARELDAQIGAELLDVPNDAGAFDHAGGTLEYPDIVKERPTQADVDTYSDQLSWLDSPAGRAFLVRRSLRETA